MAEADWTELDGGALTEAQLRFGKSAFAAFLPLDGTTVFGFQALDNVVGVRALISNVANVNPTPVNKAGDISACIKKYDTGLFSPMMFLMQGRQATSPAYILALSEEQPHKIILRKGALNSPTEIGGSANIGESDANFSTGPVNGWHHLRLSVCANPHGGAALQVQYNSDLLAGGPSAPVWDVIPGISTTNPIGAGTDYDDAMGIRHGSPALQGGFFFGIGHYNSADAGHISVFDYVKTGFQTAP